MSHETSPQLPSGLTTAASKADASSSSEEIDEASRDFLEDESASLEFELLDHAPATSHGTYLDGMNDGLEPLEDYTDGGYHPVHLGDCLGVSGRYRVLYKLGHGGFGTVWLCRDEQDARYIALKIMRGDVSSNEFLDLSLARLDWSSPGAEYVSIPADSFSIRGPNGDHQCVVLPVLGPCVSPGLWVRMGKDPGPTLRKMAHQTAQAMRFLHENGLCHGDFRPSNILVKLTNLDHLTESQLLSLLIPPEKVQVQTESGKDVPASSPKYLVPPVDLSRLGNDYLTDNICVIDFGESFLISSPPESLGIPENYLPPEVLLDEDNAIGPACDLWALGCTLFEIRQQIPLFYMIFDRDELLAETVRFFGKLPMSWWEKWEAREEFFDEQGKWIRHGDTEEWTLEVLLSKNAEIVQPGKGDDPSKMNMVLATPKAEQRLMADLLYRLFCYNPASRASIKEVLEHEWFKM